MGSVMLINASPRAPRSNSRRYAELFVQAWPGESACFALTKSNHPELCGELEHYSDLLLVFPLYADGIPVTLLNFLKTLEEHPPRHRPTVSVLINCGFLEPGQNDVAVQMVELFCGQNGYPFGSVLKIGGGEAVLDTPFRGLVRRKLRKLAGAISAGRHRSLQVTMPLPKRLFLRASTAYWTDMGGRGGVTREQMATMEIEGR